MERPRSLVVAFLAVFCLALGAAACRAPEPDDGEPEAGTGAAPAPSPTPGTGQAAPTPAPDAAASPLPAPAQRGHAADLPADRPLRAGFLVVDGVYNSELMAPYDVFHHTAFHAKPGIEVFTVSPDGAPVTTFEGLRIAPHYSFANAPAIDILVVPSTRSSMDADLQNQALMEWVRRTAEMARHVISLCDGAFVLAKAGLLDGVPATTFPDDYQRLVQMFPSVDLRVNVSFVDTGKILTSQGGARSYEVAMHLVDQLYGPQVAQAVGKGLVIPWPPDPDTMTPRIVEHVPAAPAAPSPTAPPASTATPEPAAAPVRPGVP